MTKIHFTDNVLHLGLAQFVETVEFVGTIPPEHWKNPGNTLPVNGATDTALVQIDGAIKRFLLVPQSISVEIVPGQKLDVTGCPQTST